MRKDLQKQFCSGFRDRLTFGIGGMLLLAYLARFCFGLGVRFGSILASKVSFLLETSFKNHEKRGSLKMKVN